MAFTTSLFSFIFPILLSFPFALSTNSEGNALHALRTRLSDPRNVLQSWDPTLVNPCTWFHVTCDSNSHVVRLDLGNSNISGTLGPELGELKHLQYLELYRNNIGGKLPKELGNLENLFSMDLYGNNFNGNIPKSFAKLKSLRFLRLNDNKLTGSIPRELATLPNLKVFDVSNNDLCGTIPVDGPFANFPMSSSTVSTAHSSTPAFMAASLTKPHRHHHMIHHFWKSSSKCSTFDHLPVSKNSFLCQFHHRKLFSRLPYSIFRKTKEAELAAPFSLFLSRARSSSPKFGLVGWYLGMVKTRPISTKSITAAFIYAAADLTSQTVELETSEGYDLVRTVRMAGYGMLILGPSLHYWFNFVSSVFPKRDLLSTFKKMALGQGVFGPAMTVIFFSANAALQGESVSEICARLKRDFIPTTINGILYWPVCDFITFRFFPVHLQPLVSNSFSYLWTVYMTYMASLEKAVTS